MRIHCRCRKCRARKTLSKAPDQYLRPPRCPCGGVYRVDKWANSRPWRKNLCHCDGVWFSIKGSPHRRGGGQCVYNEKLYIESEAGENDAPQP